MWSSDSFPELASHVYAHFAKIVSNPFLKGKLKLHESQNKARTLLSLSKLLCDPQNDCTDSDNLSISMRIKRTATYHKLQGYPYSLTASRMGYRHIYLCVIFPRQPIPCQKMWCLFKNLCSCMNNWKERSSPTDLPSISFPNKSKSTLYCQATISGGKLYLWPIAAERQVKQVDNMTPQTQSGSQ